MTDPLPPQPAQPLPHPPRTAVKPQRRKPSHKKTVRRALGTAMLIRPGLHSEDKPAAKVDAAAPESHGRP